MVETRKIALRLRTIIKRLSKDGLKIVFMFIMV